MPTYNPITIALDEDYCRGRNSTVKCLFRPPDPVHGASKLTHDFDKKEQTFRKEWFSGNPENDALGNQKAAKCFCGQEINSDNNLSMKAGVGMKMEAYPPYLKVSNRDTILVKGTTCRLIIRFVEAGVLTSKIALKLAKLHPSEKYTTNEVRSIIRTCASLGLEGDTTLATDGWEGESIEGWWMKEDSFCETLRREQPVSEAITGYESDNGWWRQKQSARHRDWSIWGFRSVGPERWRRDQHRLYNLNGSEALRTIGTN